MRRFFLGVFLLLFFLFLGLWTAYATDYTSEAVSQTLTQAAEAVLAGDTEAGTQLVRKARQDWESHWKITAAVADHGPMDEIDGLFGQLEAFQKAGATADIAACCARLSKLVAAIGEAHSLTWWNLL